MLVYYTTITTLYIINLEEDQGISIIRKATIIAIDSLKATEQRRERHFTKGG
jgi:hypothetical protein